MPLQMRHAALRSAFRAKAADASIVVVDQLEFENPKTKTMASAAEHPGRRRPGAGVMPAEGRHLRARGSASAQMPDAKLLARLFEHPRSARGTKRC